MVLTLNGLNWFYFPLLIKIVFPGEYIMLLHVSHYVPNSIIVLETDSILKPKFTVQLNPQENNLTQLTFRYVISVIKNKFNYLYFLKIYFH